MDKELVSPSQSEHGPASDSSALPTPSPPRLTPNPMLLDSPAPSQTPVTSSPPPPLTPAPSLSAPKMVAAAARTASPHVLIPAPPKLTPTASTTLRTYARPILPAASKTTPTSPLPPSSSGDVTSSSTTTTSSAVTTLSTKTSTTLTNGNTRTISTPTSNTITPFHTPASPPGRQAAQPLPVSSASTMRANQSPSAVRQRASQQAVLLGKGPKGAVQDQVLLRAQMLQSLTLRPPPPGALTIPHSLRLKPPSSLPPPLTRPQTALFPPLRPRPPPSTVTTESPATPGRHLAVPPPTLYSPVRAVPLRPRLHCVRAASPRIPLPLQTMTTVSQAPAVGFKRCSSPQSKLGTSQSQLSSLPASFETSPSASRQLQIIALSSARQPPSFPQTSAAPVVASPESCSQSKRTLSGQEVLPLPQSPSSPPRLQPQTLSPKGEEAKERDTQPEGLNDEGSVAENDQRDKDEEGDKMEAEKDTRLLTGTEQEGERGRDNMDVTEEGQSERQDGGEDRKMEVEEEGEAAMNRTSPLVSQTSETVKVSEAEPETITSLLSEPLPVQNPSPELPQDLQNPNQEDICENMSTQSDNHSALSSLSSQSPPSSPFIGSSSEAPPQPVNLSQSKHGESDGKQSVGRTQIEPEPPDQSEEELESQQVGGAWEPRVWPEGRQVLTHLVEGFVIQEGLQPFPVNRSSLLLPQQAAQPQEVNGTNGKAALLPVTEASEPAEHSSDSDEEGGDTDETTTRSGHRDRTVLHCQFCGKRGHAHNFMRSKRFCSTSCARGFNVRLTKRLRALSAGSRTERPRPVLNRAQSVPGKPLLLRLPRDLWSAGRREKDAKEEKVISAQEEEEQVDEEDEEEEEEDMEAGGEEEEEDDEGEEDPAVAVTTRIECQAAAGRMRSVVTTPTSTFKPAPCQWSVEEVTSFIRTLPGCSEVADAFRLQEIDGQALLLLTEDHLMTSMNIKLGPALKICAHINALKNQ
ncbi:polyhomeotic-like protein 3 isoform X2 [Dunckerocampus dactyliophorus]|uniref:polyhomeotic-like protein 3 isoform X2 n=1 Tax=Dunckerocampus dactyliophorus TaxID=161453 RepID=UPI002405E7D9|nr:polyhomeotic-like protein 3 isoform X2 [Dunckerocampus dactyliophorus]